MRIILIPIVFALLLPSVATAEELLPAICQQVLAPDKSTSVTEIISKHVIEKVKGIPSQITQDVKGAIDKAAGSLAETLEEKRSNGSIAAAGAVRGTSTAQGSDLSLFDKAANMGLGALAFLLRHWLISLASLGLVIIGWSLRV